MKNGVQSTELYVTAIVNVIAAAIAIFAMRGMVTAEEAEAIEILAYAVVQLISLIVMGYTTAKYTTGRTEIKVANLIVNGEQE